jgi:uncharacterized protein (DUF488 family)
MTKDALELFTIGHSNHDKPAFGELLRRHGITVVADVRSSPYSKFNPVFNRETLKAWLPEYGCNYVFLGAELGARRKERECYIDGVARYELIAKTALFKSGLERIERGIKEHRIALMCAEKDPITCHRTVLVCRQLRDSLPAARILHILEDGALETAAQADERLLKTLGKQHGDLFQSPEEVLRDAYAEQGRRIAYVEQKTEAEGIAAEVVP